MRKTVSRDQIIAIGFLLGFERITYADMSILTWDYLRQFEEYAYETMPFSPIEKYIQTTSYGLQLLDGLTLQSYLKDENTSVKKYLEEIAGKHFQQYVPHFRLEKFMLQKINCGSFSEESIPYAFCEMQQQELKVMEKKGYVAKLEGQNVPYQDSLQYQLSKLGQLQLYKIQYSNELKQFQKLLEIEQYDVNLLDVFLLMQDLEKNPREVLILEKYELFYSIYQKSGGKSKQYSKKK